MNEEEKSKQLNETLAFLAKKGAAAIAQDTKLSNPKIKAILEKDFDSVQRVHAVGFVQILEKEYGVDLSQWLVEYDQNLFGAKKESGLSKELPKPPKVQESSKQEGHQEAIKQGRAREAEPQDRQESQESPKVQVQEQEQPKGQPKEQWQEQPKEPKEPKESKRAEKPQESKEPKEQKPKKESKVSKEPEPTQEYASPFLDSKRVGEPKTPTPEPKQSKAFFVLPVVLVVGLGVFFYLSHHKAPDQEDTTVQVEKPSPAPDTKVKEFDTTSTRGSKDNQAKDSPTPATSAKETQKDPPC
ncbi:hypothetical protein NHP190003_01520 [Helicobacter sp. NHP19-003]|uniref:Uncharacterized protein n=1 Tax=Helicobacter gastrocanis TaxID=2849641 RepID=A0ABM7S8G1_9HELI|nr:hypothetical protein [Helicobacter sp. NHP19-003]BCZ16870.1 hypothetical protein NHP190003_01520 [Helicobacter sp. NHP19-003]